MNASSNDREAPLLPQMRRDARAIFDAGLAAVSPLAAVEEHCQRDGRWLRVGDHRYDLSKLNNIYVVGASKASTPMAAAVEKMLGQRIASGTITVKYGHDDDLSRIDLVEGGHPVPDDNGVTGARKILTMVSRAGANDLVIGLISGGGSALLVAPVPGISLADKQETTRVLIACGATIHQINAVRKHLSQIKGGQLSRVAYPAPLVSLILSDVVGDDLDVIASGPTAPDRSTFADCLDIINRYHLEDQLPQNVIAHLKSGASGSMAETPKPGDPVFDNIINRIVGSNGTALAAAHKIAESLGYHTLRLSSLIEGDTTEIARMHAAIAKEVLRSSHPLAPPACLISGGETTVQITGSGKGGRNQEFALAAAMDLEGSAYTVVFSAGTDGTDGPTDAAGAISDHLTMIRARNLNLSAKNYLAQNDSYHFFKKLGDLIMTGPTRTNVMDLRILLIR